MRVLTRLLLGVLFVACIALIVFLLRGPKTTETWATLTGVLAVLAAVIAVWPALRVLELQEDATRPAPTPYFDITSRYSLLLLRVKNLGAGVAYDVRLNWQKHPQDQEGRDVTALDQISALVPQESASVLLGVPHQLFKKYEVMEFEGTLEFKDATGKRWRHPFRVSADEHRKRLIHDDELPRALYDVQQIPKALDEISKAIQSLRKDEDNSELDAQTKGG